jgi:FtsZ-binding cell division protein ZapB
MEMNSFARLEEQISKAIDHIDKLTSAAERLETENAALREQVMQLEGELRARSDQLRQLETESSRVAEQVREKIATLLSRIESYESESV